MSGDPPSITISCDSLLTTIRRVTVEIARFGRTVREARRDLDQVTREIASLELTVKSIEIDVEDVPNVPGLERQLLLVLQQCESVLRRLSTRLQEMLPGGSRESISWEFGGRDEIAALKGNLEAHQQMLDVTISLLDQAATPTIMNGSRNTSKDVYSSLVDMSETATDISMYKLNDEGAIARHELHSTPRPSLHSKNSYITEKIVSFPPETPPRYTRIQQTPDFSENRVQQTPDFSDHQTLTGSFFSRDSLEEKEVMASSKLSQVDLIDANEKLFDVFFVDRDAGYQVLSKYIPSGRVRSLLHSGASPDAHDISSRRLHTSRNGQPLHQGPGGINLAGSSVLTLAAIAGDLNVLGILLDHGAAIDASRGELGSAIHAAAMFNQRAAVNVLLDRGADPNTRGGRYGYPIIAATRKADLRVLRILLDYGAYPNARCKPYGSVLHAAICENQVGDSSERVQMLLNAGANPNTADETLGTPLLSACYTDNYSAAHLLLQSGADPNMIHGRRGAPLLAAVHRGQSLIAALLVEHGANKEVTGWIDGHERQGMMYDLLSAAISSRRPEVVLWALRSGFGTREYWQSGAFKESLAKVPLHRDLGKLKIYPMIYSHARQRGHSVTSRRTRNPLIGLMSPRNHTSE